jgi:hypothetical protein
MKKLMMLFTDCLAAAAIDVYSVAIVTNSNMLLPKMLKEIKI